MTKYCIKDDFSERDIRFKIEERKDISSDGDEKRKIFEVTRQGMGIYTSTYQYTRGHSTEYSLEWQSFDQFGQRVRKATL